MKNFIQSGKLEKIIIALVFTLIPFLLFKNGFSSGKILSGGDTITLDYPFRLFAQKMFWQYHDLPLWMPYIFGGIPLIDSTNLIYFYPLNLVYMLLPIPLYYTYTIDIIVHMLIAAFGMYLLLRQFEMKKEASLFGGFIYMIGGFLISLVYVGHSGNTKAVALMPYIFYFISKGIRENKFFHFLNASIICALCVMCVGTQIMSYAYLAGFLYIVYELFFTTNKLDMGKIKKTTIFFILSTGMIILFSALQFFQSAGYIKYSWRNDFTYQNSTAWSFVPLESLTFLFPNFFGLKDDNYWGQMWANSTTFYTGIVPLLLMPLAFVMKKSRKQAIFFAVTALIFFLFGCGYFTPLYRIVFYIPVFNKFRAPLRFIYVVNLFIIILSAMAMNNILILTNKHKYKRSFERNALLKIWAWTAAAIAIILLIMWAIASDKTFLANFIRKTSSYTSYFTKKPPLSDEFISARIKEIATDIKCFGAITFTFLFIVYLQLRRRIKQPYVFLCLIVILSLIDLYRVDRQFIKFDNLSDHFNDNDQIMQRLQQDKEPARTADFSYNEPANKNIYYGLEFMSGNHGLTPLKYANMLTNKAFDNLTINKLFNIKYYITNIYYETRGFVKIFDGPIKIIEDTKVMPRAFFSDKTNKLDNDDQELSFMKSALFDPLSVLTTDSISINPNPEKLQYNLHITEYTPNRIKISLETNKAGILVISNSYYPSWRAKVDGKLEKIYNVDYAIMGVPVEKGKHEIVFYYSRAKILISLFLTLLGILIYIMVYFFEIKKKRNSI